MPANYVLLQQLTTSQTVSSVTLNNIPQTGYTDLELVYSLRADSASNYSDVGVTFTGATYSGGKILYAINGTTAGTYSPGGPGYFASGTAANNTSNVYSNGHIYIPNYTSTGNKTISAEAVGETNGSNTIATISAGLYTSSTGITAITLTPSGGNVVVGSTFYLYGIAATGTTPATYPKAIGGNITTDGTYWIHTFTSSGTFTPLTNLTCDYLVVAGGGSGAGEVGGGGGAGGLRSTVTATGGGGSLESRLSLIANTNYAAIVGAGGSGASNATGNGGARGVNGVNSTFATITAIGGGGGGNNSTPTLGVGLSGGSGGGNGEGQLTTNTGTANQGYAGGVAYDGANYGAGGGGGAGQAGYGGTSGSGGYGGNGVATVISGTSTYYAGGGAGAVYTSGSQGQGGLGGGGNGGVFPSNNGTAGTANTGGGGGGGAATTGLAPAGGSGIVIVRYAV